MANEFKITDVVDPKATQQLKDLSKEFENTTSKYAELVKAIAGGIKNNPSDLEAMDKKQKEYISTLKDLIVTQNKLSSIQERQNKLIEDYGNKISKLLTLNTLPKQFDDLTKSINKVSGSLDDLSSKFEKSSTSQNAASQSNQQYTQAVQQTAQAISLTTKQYAEIINNVMAYDENAGKLNRNLAENKIQLDGIRRELAILSKEFQRGAISRDVYISKTEELTRKEQELSAQNKQYTALLRNHASVVVSTAGSYNEMSSAVLQLEKRFKDLAPALRSGDMGKGLLTQISTLKNELKSIDSQMGNYQRNVGNYSSHWNGLGMSVQQVARELPSLAMGWNTFFLAISNNLPILSDELKKANAEFKAMQASGQKATPVWKQMAGAIFNWQTALVVGITLLSVYGKDIINWAGNLLKAKSAAIDLNSAEQELALSRREAMKDYAKEKVQLDILYNSLKRTTISTNERNAAVNEWISKYKNHSDIMDGEKISIDKLYKSYQSLSKEIYNNAIARKYSDKAAKLSVTISQEQLKVNVQKRDVLKAESDLERSKKAYEEDKMKYGNSNKQEEKDALNRQALAVTISKNRLNTQIRIQEELKNNVREVTDTYNVFIGQINKIQSLNAPKDMGYDFWQQQADNARIALKQIKSDTLTLLDSGKFNGIDKLIVESYKSARKQLSEANKNLSAYDGINKTDKQFEKEAKEQLSIRQEYQQSEFDLMDEGLDKELAKIALSYNKRIAAVKGNSEEEIKTRENLSEKMQDELDKYTMTYNFNKEKESLNQKLELVEEGSQEELDLRLSLFYNQMIQEKRIAEENGEDLSDIEKKFQIKREKELEKFADAKSKKLEEQYAISSAVASQAMHHEISEQAKLYTTGIIDKEEFEKRKADITEKYAIQQAQDAIDLAKNQLETADLSPESKLALKQKLAEAEIALAKEVCDAEVKAADDSAKAQKEKLEKIADGLKMVGDFLNAFADLGSAIYERKIEEIEGEQEKNQEVGEAEQERIDKLAESGAITSEEAEARKRAAAAKTSEKDKELAKKKADLQTKQAKMEKANAIAQSIINTALGITKTIAELGFPAAIPFVITAGILGAVQLATIIAQPIPKYAKGTDNHPGGLAVVGDGGKQEMIVSNGKSWITPSVPTLVDIPKGAVVLPDVMNMDSIRHMRSDLVMLANESAKKGNPVTVNVNNDYRKLEGGIDRLNSSFNTMAKYQRKAAVQADLRNISSRL